MDGAGRRDRAPPGAAALALSPGEGGGRAASREIGPGDR